MKKGTVRALIAALIVIDVAAAATAIAGVRSLPPKCSTELIAVCDDSIECLRIEVAKVKSYCRKALLDGALPATLRRD